MPAVRALHVPTIWRRELDLVRGVGCFAPEVVPMFARVSTFQGSPERVDEGIKIAEEQALPAAKALEGFKGMLMLVDRDAGKSIAVTLWESEEAMNASVEAANKIRGDVASAAGEQIVSVEQYEVAIDVPV